MPTSPGTRPGSSRTLLVRMGSPGLTAIRQVLSPAPDQRELARPLLGRAALIGLTCIVALGLALRVWGVDDNPRGFFADEAAYGYNAYTILRHGADEYGNRFPLFFRSFGDYKLPLSVYGLVPFVGLLGLTETGVRLAAAFTGAATIVAVYFLALVLFRSPLAALAAALVLAVQPWHVHYSRIGFMEVIQLPLFLAVGLALFWRGLERPVLWLWAAAVLALTFYTYRGAWLFLPPLLLAIGVIYWRPLLAQRRTVALGAAIFLVLLLPLAWHLLMEEGDRAGQVALVSVGDRGGWWEFAKAYGAYYSPSFLFQRGDDWAITRHYLPGQGHLYWIQAPFILLGLAALLWWRLRAGLVLLAALAFYPLSGVLTEGAPISSRTVHGALLFALLTGGGVAATAWVLRSHAPPRWGRYGTGLLLAGVLAIIGLQTACYVQRYHSDYPALSAGYWGWQWGPGEIIPYFVSVQDKYDALYLDGEFNAPHIFLRFYAPDPEDCRNCYVGSLEEYQPHLRQLFAVRPHNLDPAHRYHVAETLTYPNGETAFLIVEVLGPR